MIGLLVVTHASIAQELLRATEMIIGPVSQAEAVSVTRQDSVEQISELLRAACASVDRDGDGVMILTDMFGGTPTNLSLQLLEDHRAEIVAGVNLPMMIKFFNSRDASSIEELARSLRSYAADKIVLVSDMLAHSVRGQA